ncbi:MAG TPA: HNH endonuclease signature motif containing protein, partial [Gammaproteobacteria bacterium]|nr:HNH endonuclease signature motif containing protein [Gammaproteobacteria bacterium]
DAEGTPLALGRKRRVVSTVLKRLLWTRDRGCTFPGCHRKHYVEAHHVRAWAEGGKTEPKNLTLLCSFHHRLLHEGGFSIRRCRGRLEFLRRDGRVIPRSGYRREDMVDDVVDDFMDERAGEVGPEALCPDALCPDALESTCRHPSAEGFVSEPYSSAEQGRPGVREPRAGYRVCQSVLQGSSGIAGHNRRRDRGDRLRDYAGTGGP